MTDIKFSTGLFEQLGGNLYLSRPAYFEKNVFAASGSCADKKQFSSSAQSTETLKHQATSETVDSERPLVSGLLQAPQASVVILGAGLNSIWEDESKLEWQLLQNICQAFDWSEEELSFFDTDSLITEDSMYTTTEEVIELGVEWVLSMDAEHAITEQLSQGVQVVEVPDLEQMLSDPYSKQSFYQSVSPFLSNP